MRTFPAITNLLYQSQLELFAISSDTETYPTSLDTYNGDERWTLDTRGLDRWKRDQKVRTKEREGTVKPVCAANASALYSSQLRNSLKKSVNRLSENSGISSKRSKNVSRVEDNSLNNFGIRAELWLDHPGFRMRRGRLLIFLFKESLSQISPQRSPHALRADEIWRFSSIAVCMSLLEEPIGRTACMNASRSWSRSLAFLAR